MSALLILLFTLMSCKDKGAQSVSKYDDPPLIDSIAYVDYDVQLKPKYVLPEGEIECEIPQLLPERLKDHCLYPYTIAEKTYKNFHLYDVKYPLWTDGAQKKRWIYLPPNTQINTLDIDEWIFPVGTILWKEFSYNGLLVETRVLEKLTTGASGWRVSVFAWSSDQSNAMSVTTGDKNVLGTGHDIPSIKSCQNCHSGRSDYAIGPEALQLEHRDKKGLNLDKLELLNLLTHPIKRPAVIMADKKTQNALGYLHANCSHCHNSEGKWPASIFGDPANFNYRHLSRAKSKQEENAYITLFKYNKINLGSPNESNILVRMKSSEYRMPPVGVEKTDHESVQILLDWIKEEAKLRNNPTTIE